MTEHIASRLGRPAAPRLAARQPDRSLNSPNAEQIGGSRRS